MAGLYGSPDTGNLYTGEENKDKNKKPKLIDKKLLIALIVFDCIIGYGSKDKGIETLFTIVWFDTIAVGAGHLLLWIYKVIANRYKPSYNLKVGLICGLCSFVLLFVYSGVDNYSIGNPDVNNAIAVSTERRGTRKNPASIGEPIQIGTQSSNGLKFTLEIELLEVKKGNEAQSVLEQIHDYSGGPGGNRQYVFAKFRVKNLKNNSGKDAAFTLNNILFSYSTGNYAKYNDYISIVGLEPDINAELYEGAEHEGWITLYIENSDSSPKALFLGGDGVWFNL